MGIPFFFGILADICPDEAAETLDAAFQIFDGATCSGKPRPAGSNVLYDADSGMWIAGTLIASWSESANTEVTPPNHFRPIRGFNRVWTHERAIRERLGWATGIEQAHTAQ